MKKDVSVDAIMMSGSYEINLGMIVGLIPLTFRGFLHSPSTSYLPAIPEKSEFFSIDEKKNLISKVDESIWKSF